VDEARVSEACFHEIRRLYPNLYINMFGRF
jgi:hypothetical protein